jgi:exodeoxyribonuclease III
LRILSWNILQGGGTRIRGIAAALVRHRPDVVTLQEFRAGSGDEIITALKQIGCRHIHVPDTETAAEHTILIASRFAFDAGPFMPVDVRPLPVLEAYFNDVELTLLAAHFPQKELQVPIFEQLIKDTPSLLKGDCLLMGDLNCGIPFVDSMTKTFVNTQHFQEMLSLGWIDCWRCRHKGETEYTWISAVKKHGFRYDHALASQGFDKRIKAAVYDQSVRLEGHSDHAALLIET